jgi:predicted Zn-dependent protease
MLSPGKPLWAQENMTYNRPLPKLFLRSLILLLAVFATVTPLRAADAPIIIRDTEIEDTFKEWMEPLLAAAGLNKESVNLIIVQSPQINAFVAGGANIFIYTGLIESTENPGEVIGVLGHELGHIDGGHLIAARTAMERASYESILGMVLGVGVALATGEGGAASTIAAGSSTMAMRGYLSHSRVQESSADQAALRFFESAQLSPVGLETFFEKLESEELLPAEQQSEYMRTHPLTRDRIDAVHQRAQQSPYVNKAFPAAWTEQHKRMKAKLAGFITPTKIPWVYGDRDTSIPALYAKAIAAYRNRDVDVALQRVDQLIATEPENPYFQELKGQMLVEFGRVADGVPYYQKAANKLPDAGLIRLALGHALLETGHEQEAIDNLERAQQDEPRSSRIFRLLATAYGRLGNENMARLNLAEEAVLQRQIPYARNQAQSVLKNTKQGSREWIKAKDILAHIETIDDEDD